jgi:hypothetical protein
MKPFGNLYGSDTCSILLGIIILESRACQGHYKALPRFELLCILFLNLEHGTLYIE